uniref:Ubiquitin-like protease family profile domain-containing protein n=1 Tax=Brassica oleracea var. oleracea TaxID=109376 RepID=A0A0D3CYB4_BRAOL
WAHNLPRRNALKSHHFSLEHQLSSETLHFCNIKRKTMGDNTLRIGLLGCIRFASKFVRTVTQSSNAVIIAISDPSIETANTFAAANNLSPETVSVYGSYEELLNDPRVDAVYLTMLVTQRAKWAVTAAEKKKHLLVEKPPAQNAAEIDKIVEACESNGVQFMDGTIWLHHKRTVNIRETMFDSGLLGDIRHSFCKGVLPPHGQTQEIWNVDVDRLYVPVHVSGNHWIALCISFVTRSIDVFDCSGRKRYKELDGFANLVPRIVKAVQPPSYQKDFTFAAYTVHYVPMGKLNKSACDCGVYTIKFIECHSLGLKLSMVNDGNIKEARHRILWDLWEAANDPELVERMSNYEPPECLTSTVEEIL